MVKPTFDPTRYCRDHMQEFLPGVEPTKVRIGFHLIHSRLFRSTCRPAGYVTMNYPFGSQGIMKKQVWAKIQEQPEKAFCEMKQVYSALTKYNLQKHMPVPYSVDPTKNMVFTGFVPGESLIGKTIGLLMLRSLPDWLLTIYYRIGEWLSAYHRAMAKENTIRLGDLLQETKTALALDNYFSNNHKQVLEAYLDEMERNPGSEYQLWLTRPHNDFCLRNIILTDHSDFCVIDWDAMVNPLFPQESSIWNDLTTFSTNTQSLIRFYPFVSVKQIAALLDSFQTGYFAHDGGEAIAARKPLFWLFTVIYFLGMVGDRSLPGIYKTHRTERYIAALVQTLLRGEYNVAAPPSKQSSKKES